MNDEEKNVLLNECLMLSEKLFIQELVKEIKIELKEYIDIKIASNYKNGIAMLIGEAAWDWLQENKDFIYEIILADIEFNEVNQPFIKNKYQPKLASEIDESWFKSDSGDWSTIIEEHTIILEIRMYNELL